jgi:hypothetical protein
MTIKQSIAASLPKVIAKAAPLLFKPTWVFIDECLSVPVPTRNHKLFIELIDITEDIYRSVKTSYLCHVESPLKDIFEDIFEGCALDGYPKYYSSGLLYKSKDVRIRFLSDYTMLVLDQMEIQKASKKGFFKDIFKG